VQTIIDLVSSFPESQQRMSVLLKEDLNKAADMGDVGFINDVVVPILHAEEK